MLGGSPCRHGIQAVIEGVQIPIRPDGGVKCVDSNAFFFDDLERRGRLDGDPGGYSVLGISLGVDLYLN